MTRLKRFSAALLGTAVILSTGGAAYAATPPTARPLNAASAATLGQPSHGRQFAQADRSDGAERGEHNGKSGGADREDHDNGKSDRNEHEDHNGKSGDNDREDDGNGKTGGAQQEGEHEGQF